MEKMEQDLFAHLPSETIIDILSRLSVRCIATSKCVCKPWLDLLDSDDFVNSHFSKSSAAAAAALAVSLPETRDSYPFKLFELDEELDDLESQNPITKFDFPRKGKFDGAAYGLLFLRNAEVRVDDLYVCNPITREFIELPFHEEFVDSSRFRRVAYGFGASKVTRQHKVVRLDSASDYCHVYTLGTGRWRRVEAASGSASSAGGGGTFLNGFLYWKVSDSKYNTWISWFDLETERFGTVPPPPVRRGGSLHFDLVTLRDSLYGVDDSTDDEIVLWLLEEVELRNLGE